MNDPYKNTGAKIMQDGYRFVLVEESGRCFEKAHALDSTRQRKGRGSQCQLFIHRPINGHLSRSEGMRKMKVRDASPFTFSLRPNMNEIPLHRERTAEMGPSETLALSQVLHTPLLRWRFTFKPSDAIFRKEQKTASHKLFFFFF